MEHNKIALDLIENGDFVVLDSETTGLGDLDQVIELSIIGSREEIKINQRFLPNVRISAEASAVHGIKKESLAGAPEFPDKFENIKSILTKKGTRVVIYNSDFDLRILSQTCKAFGLPTEWLCEVNAICAMQLAASAYGATNQYGTISLANAVIRAGVKWRGKAHSALADTLATLDVVREIAKERKS